MLAINKTNVLYKGPARQGQKEKHFCKVITGDKDRSQVTRMKIQGYCRDLI